MPLAETMERRSRGPRYPFTEDEFNAAAKAWGCNCGPSSLAFACQIELDQARRAIPNFDTKRYTSPTMMVTALANLGAPFLRLPVPAPSDAMNCNPILGVETSLVRVQWHGPWTAPGANPKWAYRQTHWITLFEWGATYVFDCNGGMMTLGAWIADIVPFILKHIPRSDGRFSYTHILQLTECGVFNPLKEKGNEMV